MKKQNTITISSTDSQHISLGYNTTFEQSRHDKGLSEFPIARVIAEHKDRYVVRVGEECLDAEVMGNLRFSATSSADFPSVGDWVAISQFDSSAFIHGIIDRQNTLSRKLPGREGEEQIIATNIDCALIVVALDRDFNLNRIERYLSLCNQEGIEPKVLFNKCDLFSEQERVEAEQKVKDRFPTIDCLFISALDNDQAQTLKNQLQPTKTYCILGSSGVGKSTLINQLLGNTRIETQSIGEKTQRGKHTTTHRELFVLDNGAIVIDNPGIREVGIGHHSEGIQYTFDDISTLGNECRYADCTHIHEKGCRVLEAVENGELIEELYENYVRLWKESQHYESDNQSRKRKEKSLAKVIKTMKKNKVTGNRY